MISPTDSLWHKEVLIIGAASKRSQGSRGDRFLTDLLPIDENDPMACRRMQWLTS